MRPIRYPKGIRNAVDKYADRIEKAVRLSVQWDKPLGAGSFGVVFPTSDPEKVLKISSDPTEGPVVKAVMDTKLDRRLDGLGRWYGVWRLPEPINEGNRATGWVILREDVKPFDMMSVGFPVWFNYLQNYNKHARKSIDLKTAWKKEREWEEAQVEIGHLYNFEETYYVAEAIEQLNRDGIRLADVHAGNLGHRLHATEEQPGQTAYWYDKKERSSLLIFDLGHSSAPAGVTVESLWEEAVQKNPGIEAYAGKIKTL